MVSLFPRNLINVPLTHLTLSLSLCYPYLCNCFCRLCHCLCPSTLSAVTHITTGPFPYHSFLLMLPLVSLEHSSWYIYYCHCLFVTLSPSPSLCHFLFVTLSPSPSLCHFVTLSPSPSLCHFVTLSLSLYHRHHHFVTLSLYHRHRPSVTLSLFLCHTITVTFLLSFRHSCCRCTFFFTLAVPRLPNQCHCSYSMPSQSRVNILLTS